MRFVSLTILLLWQSSVYGKRYYLMRLPNGGFGETEDEVLAPAPPPPPKVFSNTLIEPAVENAPVVNYANSLPVAPQIQHHAPSSVPYSSGSSQQGGYPPKQPQQQSYPSQQQNHHGSQQNVQQSYPSQQNQQQSYPSQQNQQKGYPSEQSQQQGYQSQQQTSQQGYPSGSGSAHGSSSSNQQIPIAAIAIISGKGKNPIDPHQVKTSEGKCEFDAECWHVKPQVAIANGVMFDRTTGATCEDCLAQCQQFQSADSPWICRAVTYDHRWQICDLFAVSGHEKPQFLTDYYGRDYFTPTGGEQCAAGGDDCEKDDLGRDQVAVYCKWQDSEVTGSDSLDAKEEKECISACKKKGEGCKGFTFDGNSCTFTDSPLRSNEFPPERIGSGYYEKTCLPAELVKDPEDFYDIIPNYILVGHVQEVTDASSLRECKLQCLQALEFFGFECKSAMFYPTDPDQNCLLNSETRCTQQNVFIPEDQGVQMIYFDVGASCRSRSRRFSGGFIARDDPIPLEDDEKPIKETKIWTNWTKCSSSKLYRNRFLKCKQKDVRKCPKQSLRCSESEKGVSSLRKLRRGLAVVKRL